MRKGSAHAARRKVAMAVVSALLVAGVAGVVCGVQTISDALAAEGEVPAVPQLTASSSTSQEQVSSTQPIVTGAVTEGAQADGALPRLTSSSESSRTNLEGLQVVATAAAGGRAPASDTEAVAPETETSAEGDIADLVGESFSMEADCTACHTKEVEKMQIEGFTGANHKDLTCIMCHDNEADLTAAHEEYSVKQASRVVALVNTSVDESLCFSCHGDREALVAATAESTVLTDANGTTVNPHALPEGDQHAGIACGSCHKMHNDLTTVETAQNTCLSCHHDNVYECNTCHVV